MGSVCICMQNRVIFSDYNIRCSNNSLILLKHNNKHNNDIPSISHTFKSIYLKTSHSQTISSIIKIQSIYRGYSFRKAFPISMHFSPKLNNSKRLYFQVITKSSSQDNININLNNTNNLSITKSSMCLSSHPVFQQYPALTDGVKVILIQVLFPNMSEYSGEWNPDKKERHGRGIQIWSDKSSYIGMWKDDKINGMGKLILNTGEYYEGNFINDKANGYGVYMYNNGSVYIGSWKDNVMSGFGKFSWKNVNEEYEGEFVRGKMSGNGTFKFRDGSVYVGEFCNNKIQGKGTKTWKDNRMYKGEFKDGKIDGEGEFTWGDGRKYKGHYVDEQKNGFGEFTWVNGKRYKGFWRNGKQDGKGEIYLPKYDCWKKGTWFNGKLVMLEG